MPLLAIPGFVDAHCHGFQRSLRGCDRGGDFWSWREEMLALAGSLSVEDVRRDYVEVYRELKANGYTAVGEFHYLGLAEARTLTEEAAALLAEYQRKRQAAEGEAQDIISGAKAEAERMAAEAKTRIEDFVARRTKMAETKIAQAEAQAAADVRSAAAEAAIAAAETILSAETKGRLAGDLIAKGIDDVRKKLN